MAIVFILFLVCNHMDVFVCQQEYRKIEAEKERIEESLLYAVNAAAIELTSVMEETDETKLYTYRESFFRALYVRMGIAGVEEEQEKMKLHFPLLAFLTEEGGYFFYTEKTFVNGSWSWEQKWSRKIPYLLTGEKEMDQKILKEYLEKHVGKIITDHNYIAEQYGIEYEFFVPHFMVDEKEELTLPMMIVVFQGWPLERNRAQFYENCIDAGAYIKRLDDDGNFDSSFLK